MRDRKSLVIVVILLSFFMELNLVFADSKQLNLVPEPVSLKVTDGIFKLRPDTVIVADNNSDQIAEQLVEMLKPAAGFALKVRSSVLLPERKQTKRGWTG